MRTLRKPGYWAMMGQLPRAMPEEDYHALSSCFCNCARSFSCACGVGCQAIADKKKTIGSSGCTIEQIKKYSSKCSNSSAPACEGNTVSCCNFIEDELGLPEGFCIVVSEGRGSRPGIRANPGKAAPLTVQ
jgi:hypothetical protein